MIASQVQFDLLTKRLNRHLGRKLETTVKVALDGILENGNETSFKYKLEANLKQSQRMIVRFMRTSYVDLFVTEREASQYVTTFFNTYSGAVVHNYLLKKRYYKTPNGGLVFIPRGEITDYSPNGGVFAFTVEDRCFSWDTIEEIYYDFYNRVYNPYNEVVIGAKTPRYIKEAYKKLVKVRIKEPRATLFINQNGDHRDAVIGFNEENTVTIIDGFANDFSTQKYPEVGTLEGIAPIWGPSKEAYYDLQDGDYGSAAFNSVMAVSDVFLLNSIRKGVMKGGLKAMTMGNTPWWSRQGNSYRKFYGNTKFIQKGQHGHHWLIHQNGKFGKYIPGAFKNQMWNIKPMWPKIHFNAGHGKWYLGSPPMTKIGQFWYGTPSWSKYFILSSGTRVGQEFRNYDD